MFFYLNTNTGYPIINNKTQTNIVNQPQPQPQQQPQQIITHIDTSQNTYPEQQQISSQFQSIWITSPEIFSLWFGSSNNGQIQDGQIINIEVKENKKCYVSFYSKNNEMV